MSETQPVIEFRNVSKVYNNGTEALHNINLKVEKGEFVFIVGSSGAGKSTFLKLINCEERPNEGQIFLDGEEISRLRKGKIPYIRRKMGNVFQDFRLIEHMSVYDNVAFAMRVVGASGRAIKKRVPYILSLVGLQHKAKHRPSELSGGERQRVGLARALVNNPSLIIADEPTGNIDPALSFEIVDLLNEINRRGTTILMVTHEHSLVKHFHKRIIQIHSGEIVADTAEIQAAVQDNTGPIETESSYQEVHETSGDEMSYARVDEPVAEVVESVQTLQTDDGEIVEIYEEADELTADISPISDEVATDDISTESIENYVPGSDDTSVSSDEEDEPEELYSEEFIIEEDKEDK